jgi:UDP-N-acetylglucosamine 1-carboxyvinyltransferase
MAATLLAEGEFRIGNLPRILDVEIMAELLRRMGCEVRLEWTDESAGTACVTVPGEIGHEADYDLVRQFRASIAVLGPLLARCGLVRVARPGGDAIGSRGLDMHIDGLTRLGARITTEHGFLVAEARSGGLVGATVELEFPSVGATENILMASVLAKGETVIDNAAREPEIADLCAMLALMGAKIDGAGTSTITVEGVSDLAPVTYSTVSDRIVAGTWAIGAVMTRGDVFIERAVAEHMTVALNKLTDAGAEVEPRPDGVRVVMRERPRCVDVVTLPYPGFPTDLQPMAVALAAVSTGTALITENVFEGRFMFVNELVRLGASVRIDGHHAVVRGRERLSSAPVVATDIRAGAGLVLAGLVSDGVTEVQDVHHVDRGYPDFVQQLRGLGAEVERTRRPD